MGFLEAAFEAILESHSWATIGAALITLTLARVRVLVGCALAVIALSATVEHDERAERAERLARVLLDVPQRHGRRPEP
ncbi:hypothetical protein [Demequina sp.]|uniref:hypothetical protein n=1 Tax=Demequina sp. TaxID=2050685 RepID=UPI003D0BA763